MCDNFSLGEKYFNRVFPFYILINRQLIIADAGSTLRKIFAGLPGMKFKDGLKLRQPQASETDFESLQSLAGQFVVLECYNEKHTSLGGQIEYLPQTDQLLFVGTPRFNSIEEIKKNNFVPEDFALHDSTTDLLQVIRMQETVVDDLKQQLKAAERQKNELKEVNNTVNDSALFSTQNPDPLIRINFWGDVIQNNPAASKLDFLEFEDKVYRNDDFFKLISSRIDTTKSRWLIEARSGGKDYSFVCISMMDDGYINIYGRDISRQKKDRRELEKLSLIVQQSINPIVITGADGKVEWVNSAFEKITGYSLTDALGKTPGSFLQGKETDPAASAYMRKQIVNAEPFCCEVYNYKKSGEGYWIRVNGQPVFDKAGRVIKFFAMEEDITKEREAELKLNEFDKRIHVAIQKIGDNVWEQDFVTGETSFSQQEYQLLGYTSDEFKNNINFWHSRIHEDDIASVTENENKYKSGQADHHSIEYRIIHKNGSIKWVLDRGVVIEKCKDGTPAKIIGTHTDITQQKENEKKLEATASRLSSLIENLHAGILLENESRYIELTNKQFCNMFNIDVVPVQLIGTDCSQSAEQTKHFFNNPEAFVLRINEILADRKIVIGDQLELIDGRFFERDFIPIWNEGRYNGNLWVYNDITEKINADKKLDEQRRFYEEILDNIPADIAVFDNQHHYLYLNPVAIKDAELRKWIIGKKDEDYVHLKNKPISIVEGRRKIFNNVLKSKQLNSWEEELKQPDGSACYVMRNMYPVLNDAGEVSLVIGYGMDITNIKTIQQQIKQSEKRYRDVIENSLAIVTTHDLEGRFLTVNPMVKKLYGYSDEEVIGHPLTDFMPAEDKLLFEENYLDKINQEKVATGIFRVLHKDGSIVYSLYNNYLKEEPGKEPYVIGFAVDITDRLLAEKELKIAKKVMEELVQTKQNFLANMSHEIRTPMNAIIGMSNQLAKSTLTETQQFYLKVIHTSADNLLVIINDILDLSKIDAGKLTLEKLAFEPRLVVERVMQVMMHRAEEKGLVLINSSCDKMLYPVLMGDPYRLNQVLLNLVSNSLKFTEKGFVDISCAVIAEDENTQTVQVCVTDTGIGMDESFAKNLFNKFTQEDESVTRRFGGTGLGMSICKELIELMGGNITVESIKGQGTKVLFTICFEKGIAAQLPVKETHQVDTSIFKNRRILVTDDNEMNRLVASTVFENYGCIIDEAVNGAEAVEKIKQHTYDIVLMDVQMPVMDGFEATKIIRNAISKDLPVIALTAFAINGDNLKCLDAGMNDYLSKPFEESQLLYVVSKWLLKYEAKQETQTKDIISDPTPLYDLSGLIAISKGNHKFVNKMIMLFCDQTPAAVKEIQQAFANRDYKKIKAAAHRIKPSIDSMGIQLLKNEIRLIETRSEDNRDSEELGELIQHLHTVVEQVVDQLQLVNEFV